MQKKVPHRTVERLCVYRKVLEDLHGINVENVFSSVLARRADVSPAQLRKDLSVFGSFGNPARGYNVGQLIHTISTLLGTVRMQKIVLVGLGNLGQTLLFYEGFADRGFTIGMVLDSDPDKAGRVFAGRPCYHIDQIEQVIPNHGISIAILASRRTGLQELVDRLSDSGVKAFLNFVPRNITAPPGTHVEDVDIASKLEKLSFLISENAHQ